MTSSQKRYIYISIRTRVDIVCVVAALVVVESVVVDDFDGSQIENGENELPVGKKKKKLFIHKTSYLNM